MACRYCGRRTKREYCTRVCETLRSYFRPTAEASNTVRWYAGNGIVKDLLDRNCPQEVKLTPID